jgi:hypothetical protein
MLLTVTHWRSRAMSLKVLWTVGFTKRVEPTPSVRIPNKLCLCLGARHCNAWVLFVQRATGKLKEDAYRKHTWRLAVRVHARFTNNTFNVVTISDGLGEGLKKDGAEALSPGVSIRIGVPHEGSSIR